MHKLSVFAAPEKKCHWLLGHIPYMPNLADCSGVWYKYEIDCLSKAGCSRVFVRYLSSFLPFLIVCHPDTVAAIVKSSEPKPTEGFDAGYSVFKDWIGDGLILANGPKWFRNRRLLTPAFHFDILKPYMEVYNRCVDTLMEKFASACRDGKSLEISQPISLCTLDVILRCAFSHSEDIQMAKCSNSYIEATINLTYLAMYRALRPWLYPNIIFFLTAEGRLMKKYCAMSHKVATDVITERKAALEADEAQAKPKRKYVNFLDILLLAQDTNGTSLTDQEILDEVETFMFAGHDTTKSAISFILYNLARHPEIQQRARAEVQALLAGRDEEEILWEDLSKLPYLTQCIKESLRHTPPVPVVARRLSKDIILDGKLAPAGTHVDIMINSLHHNPEVWGQDHMTYDPDRFSDANLPNIDPYAFIPFSAGSRNCIGQNFAMNEIKVTVSRVINSFELTLDDSVPVTLVSEMVMKSPNGIHLHFTRLADKEE